MNRKPIANGACCLPNVDSVTYLQVGPRRVAIGMMGLEKIFEQLFLLGRRPEEASDAELVGMARNFNYIPHCPGTEAEYGEALRKAYAAFCARAYPHPFESDNLDRERDGNSVKPTILPRISRGSL